MIVSKSILCADLPHHVGQCISLKCIIHFKYVYYAPEFQHEIPKIAIFYRKMTSSKKHHSLLVPIVVSTQFLMNTKHTYQGRLLLLKLHGFGLSKSLTDSSSSSLYIYIHTRIYVSIGRSWRGGDHIYIPRTQMTLDPCF